MESRDWKVGAASCRVRKSLAFPAHIRDGIREVTKVHVPLHERRKGYADELLRQVCAEADKERIILALWPEPFGGGEMTREQLVAWYARHGFEAIQPEPVLMARKPQINPIGAAAAEAVA